MRYIKVLMPNGKDETFETVYDYEIGDGFLLNSKYPCKCIDVQKVDKDIIFIFKKAIIKYDYSW